MLSTKKYFLSETRRDDIDAAGVIARIEGRLTDGSLYPVYSTHIYLITIFKVKKMLPLLFHDVLFRWVPRAGLGRETRYTARSVLKLRRLSSVSSHHQWFILTLTHPFSPGAYFGSFQSYRVNSVAQLLTEYARNASEVEEERSCKVSELSLRDVVTVIYDPSGEAASGWSFAVIPRNVWYEVITQYSQTEYLRARVAALHEELDAEQASRSFQLIGGVFKLEGELYALVTVRAQYSGDLLASPVESIVQYGSVPPQLGAISFTLSVLTTFATFSTSECVEKLRLGEAKA
jgi:hypothetical protein